MRLYTRFIILRCPWWDDFFIVLSILSTTVGSVIYCIRTSPLSQNKTNAWTI